MRWLRGIEGSRGLDKNLGEHEVWRDFRNAVRKMCWRVAYGFGIAKPSSAGGCQDFDTQQEKRPKSGAPSNAYRSHPRLATLQRMRKGGAPIFV